MIVQKTIGNDDIIIDSIEFDSRKVESGSLFVAVKGTQTDGHQFIDQVIAKGCKAIICENIPENIIKEITYIKVADSHAALGILAANYFDNPSKNLKLIGVTGTNGKTTIVNLLFRLVRSLGYKAGLLSTIENKIEDTILPATHTTPDPVQINRLMAKMVEAGCTYAFMEVSSHAIHQKRISGLNFAGGIFTNLTQDHLDYHVTFADYLAAKKQFFDDLPASAFALSNADDKNGAIMLQNCQAKKYFYALKKPVDFKARIIENNFDGLLLKIDGQEIYTGLVGEFNAYNILAAYAALIISGEDQEEVSISVSILNTVEGRFDTMISINRVIGIVDYAHTPDALKNVLETIQSIRTRNETLITVFGAGGNRDKGKRPEMGKIASRYSDKVIITSDNPRNEDAEQIMVDIRSGIEPQYSAKVLQISNRKEAIKTACMLASPNDIILLAGKGHEKYQEIMGVKYPFDDKEMLRTFLNLQITNN